MKRNQKTKRRIIRIGAAFLAVTLGFITYSCSQKTTTKTKKQAALVVSNNSVISKPVDYEFPAEETFSVLSWNVEHFVDDFDDPYINNKREDNPSDDLALKRKLFIQAIRKVNADVVVLQEFESEKYLAQLAEDSLNDLGYRFFADAASPNWYMNVVLMSKFPLGVLHAYGDVHTPVKDYTDENGNLETQSYINTRMWTMQVFADADYEFWLTGVHLKAGRGKRNEAMRLGQIQFLQYQLKKLVSENKQVNLMIAGDFNATLGSKEINELTSDSNKPQFIDKLDTLSMTHPANEPVRRLDYMLVNEKMAKELVPGSMEVAQLFSPDSMRIISDHLPVIARFYSSDR